MDKETLKKRELKLEKIAYPTLKKKAELEEVRNKLVDLETQEEIKSEERIKGEPDLLSADAPEWGDPTLLMKFIVDVIASGGSERRVAVLKDRMGQLLEEKTPLKLISGGGDPHGKDQHEPGAKLDAGKLRASLMVSDFPRALLEVIGVVSYGAEKYSDSGWLSVPDAEKRYKDALYRHLLAAELEENDPESGHSHMAHASWNIMALMELKARRLGAKL